MSNERAAGLDWFKSTYSDNEGGACVEVAMDWRTSSYSNQEGGACVEVAADWLTSSYSNQEGGQCVEMAPGASAVHVRDSKATSGPQLCLPPSTWSAFARFASDRRL